MSKDNDTKSKITTEEEALFTSLRVGNWEDFRGQKKIKRSLKIAIDAANKRKEVLEHVIFYGPPGLGKTTLAHIIAKEMGSSLRATSGPAMERSGDLASILTNLKKGDVLFIDEIHRLNKSVEEALYPAMEDFCFDIILGKGPSARTVRLDLSPFTLVGATTQIGKISAPLRDRFGVIHKLDFYADADLAEIVIKASKKLNIKLDKPAAIELSARSRKTPRIALRLLKRVRDFSQVYSYERVNKEIVQKALHLIEVDKMGLDANDREVLEVIIDKHQGGPVGLSTLAASIAEDVTTLEDVYEPFLMRAGLLVRTPKGRVVTDKAYSHLGMKKT